MIATTTTWLGAREETLASIRALLVGINELTPEGRVERLLERIAAAPHPERMRAFLAELGALTLVASSAGEFLRLVDRSEA